MTLFGNFGGGPTPSPAGNPPPGGIPPIPPGGIPPVWGGGPVPPAGPTPAGGPTPAPTPAPVEKDMFSDESIKTAMKLMWKYNQISSLRKRHRKLVKALGNFNKGEYKSRTGYIRSLAASVISSYELGKNAKEYQVGNHEITQVEMEPEVVSYLAQMGYSNVNTTASPNDEWLGDPGPAQPSKRMQQIYDRGVEGNLGWFARLKENLAFSKATVIKTALLFFLVSFLILLGFDQLLPLWMVLIAAAILFSSALFVVVGRARGKAVKMSYGVFAVAAALVIFTAGGAAFGLHTFNQAQAEATAAGERSCALQAEAATALLNGANPPANVPKDVASCDFLGRKGLDLALASLEALTIHCESDPKLFGCPNIFFQPNASPGTVDNQTGGTANRWKDWCYLDSLQREIEDKGVTNKALLQPVRKECT